MILIVFAFIFQSDTIQLRYDKSISFSTRFEKSLIDNFPLSIGFEQDSIGNIYTITYDKQKISRYSNNLSKLDIEESVLLSENSMSLTFFGDKLLVEGGTPQVVDKNLNIIQNLSLPKDDHLYTIGKFGDKYVAILKTSHYRRDFYTIELGENYQLNTETKHEFTKEQNGHFRRITSVSVQPKLIVQTFEKKYLVETIDVDNKRKLYQRPYVRLKRGHQRNAVFIVKGMGIISTDQATKYQNKTNKNKLLDDINELMGFNSGYYYFRTSSPNENRLDFDIVDFENQTYRHIYMNFGDHVSAAKIRHGKLLIEVRDENHAKLLLYDINN